MKKIFILISILVLTVFTQAQTYIVVSRSNDTIHLQSNKLGEALKSITPGKSSDVTENYRLIEKLDNGKKSLLFVEFTLALDKVLVTYETDLINAGVWDVKVYSFNDLYNALKRENAILLKGHLLGMNIEAYQRPENFRDIINIDGIEFPSPIKLSVFETKLIQDGLNKSSELNKFSLTEEDVSYVKNKENECFIAYLLSTNFFDQSIDRSLMNDLCKQEVIIDLRSKYNKEQLNYLSKGYDNRLKIYKTK